MALVVFGVGLTVASSFFLLGYALAKKRYRGRIEITRSLQGIDPDALIAGFNKGLQP